MNEDKQRFIDSMAQFVDEALRRADEGRDYVRGSVSIVDARNCLFRLSAAGETDEEEGRYALRELCRPNDDMDIVPDPGRIERVARYYFD